MAYFFYIVLTPISTISGLWSTGNTRKYQQIDVYIYQCVGTDLKLRHFTLLNSHYVKYLFFFLNLLILMLTLEMREKGRKNSEGLLLKLLLSHLLIILDN